MEQCTNVACGYTTSIKSFEGGNEERQHFALGALILNLAVKKGKTEKLRRIVISFLPKRFSCHSLV